MEGVLTEQMQMYEKLMGSVAEGIAQLVQGVSSSSGCLIYSENNSPCVGRRLVCRHAHVQGPLVCRWATVRDYPDPQGFILFQ